MIWLNLDKIKIITFDLLFHRQYDFVFYGYVSELGISSSNLQKVIKTQTSDTVRCLTFDFLDREHFINEAGLI